MAATPKPERKINKSFATHKRKQREKIVEGNKEHLKVMKKRAIKSAKAQGQKKSQISHVRASY